MNFQQAILHKSVETQALLCALCSVIYYGLGLVQYVLIIVEMCAPVLVGFISTKPRSPKTSVRNLF
jgi:hypothetical protein